MTKIVAALGLVATLTTSVLLFSAPAQAGCRYVLLPNGQQVMQCTKN